jgi:hypothetical protein
MLALRDANRRALRSLYETITRQIPIFTKTPPAKVADRPDADLSRNLRRRFSEVATRKSKLGEGPAPPSFRIHQRRPRPLRTKRSVGRNMSFDPMAAAIDWLDAYRAGDIEAILKMCADDAVVHCGCGSTTTITRNEGLRAYWVERLREYPAFDLDNLQPSYVGTLISYVSRDGAVRAVLTFNASGQIASLTCGPSKDSSERGPA